jgi:CRP-like cAMP-binding protein
MLVWSLYGIWEVIATDPILFWQIFFSLFALLAFNLLIVYVVAGIYRRNIKLTDIFNESEFTHEFIDGHTIFEEGDFETIMYLVVKGKVDLISNEKVFETVESGGLFGEMAIIDNLPRTATACCSGDCKLIEINEKRFYSLLQELPFFAKEIMRTLSYRLRRPNHI